MQSIHYHHLRSDQYFSLNDLEATRQHVCQNLQAFMLFKNIVRWRLRFKLQFAVVCAVFNCIFIYLLFVEIVVQFTKLAKNHIFGCTQLIATTAICYNVLCTENAVPPK